MKLKEPDRGPSGLKAGMSRREALSLLSAAFLSGCGRKGAPSPEKEAGEQLSYASAPSLGRPNVVMLLLDTLRPDVLGCYGGGGEASPVMDSLASNGIRFEKAYANAPWTLPSHGSLFTGFEPHVHKQTHAMVGGRPGKPVLKQEAALPKRFDTLASALKETGYQTLGISQNPWVGALSTQDTGFDLFWELGGEKLPFPPPKGEDLKVHKVTYYFEKFIENLHRSDSPLFLFVNYITTHLPYTPPGKFRNRFLKGFPNDYVYEVTSHNWLTMKEKGRLGEEDTAHLRQLYLGEVLQADTAVGEMVSMLKEAGLFENTLLIVLSDHGECIGHHGYFDHQFNLLEDLLRVPLIIHHKKLGKGFVINEPVILSDLFPTIISCLGREDIRKRLKLPGETLPFSSGREPPPDSNGRPLFFLFRRGSLALSGAKESIAPETFKRLDRDLFAVTKGKWKMVVPGEGKPGLYNLLQQPTEKRNLASGSKEASKAGRREAGEAEEELISLLRNHYGGGGLPFPEI